MTKDKSGPAFPFVYDAINGNVRDVHVHVGMTLRDWFAGQALAGILAADAQGVKNTKNADIEGVLAAASYSVADAMIAERDKP